MGFWISLVTKLISNEPIRIYTYVYNPGWYPCPIFYPRQINFYPKNILHFWTMCNLSPWRFIPQPGGILHFDLIRLLPNPGYAFHSHLPPKIHPIEVPYFHHPKIVQNPHTIHKTTSTPTSTHIKNIPQPIPIINCQTIIKFTKISRNPKKHTTLPLVHHPNTTTINSKIIPQLSL